MPEERYYADPVPDIHRPYVAADDRYQHLDYRRVGTSGLLLPPISLGEGFPFRATCAAPGIWCASTTNTRNSGQIARGVHGVGLV